MKISVPISVDGSFRPQFQIKSETILPESDATKIIFASEITIHAFGWTYELDSMQIAIRITVFGSDPNNTA